MRDYYWTMKNGNKISVDDMTEEHLRNVLKLIIRRKDKALWNYCDATECDIY